MKTLIFTLILFAILFTLPVLAQFPAIAPDDLTVDIGFTGDNESRSGSITTILPLKGINGFLGVYGMHAYSNDEVVSEVVDTRLQGGFNLKRVSLDGFVNVERNLLKGTAREIEVGYFIRPATIERPRFKLSIGIGNSFENKQVRDDFGLEDTDPVSTPRWLLLTSVTFRNFTTTFTYSPEISFDHHEWTLEPTLQVKFRKGVSLGFAYQLYYDGDPFTDGLHYHNTYSGVLRFVL